MRFVRKPKPYTRGRGAVRFPSQARRWAVGWPAFPTRSTLSATSRPRAAARPRTRTVTPAARGRFSQVGPSFGPLAQPGGRWLGALAGVGAAVCLLVGGAMVLNQVAREAQFQSVAAHLDVLKPAAGGVQ